MCDSKFILTFSGVCFNIQISILSDQKPFPSVSNANHVKIVVMMVVAVAVYFMSECYIVIFSTLISIKNIFIFTN